MKKLFTLILITFAGAALYGQTCTPDQSLPDTAIGVYPLPYEPDLNPTGGITDTACINQPYNFTFTAVVGDTFRLGATALPLDSLKLPLVNGISNLPTGMDYTCNPPNCTFASGTKGCVGIFGTVTDPSLAGEYTLSISASVFVNGSPVGLNVQFPNPLLFPGEYILTVREEGHPSCLVNTRNLLARKLQLQNQPNPFRDYTEIKVASEWSGNLEFQVSNLFGQLVHSESVRLVQGENRIPFLADGLADGIYLYTLRNELGVVSGKMHKVAR